MGESEAATTFQEEINLFNLKSICLTLEKVQIETELRFVFAAVRAASLQ